MAENEHAASKDMPADHLMQQAKMGDTEAFGALYSLYLTPVYRYLLVQTKHKEVAEDLTQAVFIKAFRALGHSAHKSETPAGSQLAYFFTVAKTTLLDYWKKKTELTLDTEAPEIRHLADTQPGAIESLESQEQQARLLSALAVLKSEQREVVSLRFLGDQSPQEIAKMLGKSEVAIRQIQCRALKTLRNYFITHPLAEIAGIV